MVGAESSIAAPETTRRDLSKTINAAHFLPLAASQNGIKLLLTIDINSVQVAKTGWLLC